MTLVELDLEKQRKVVVGLNLNLAWHKKLMQMLDATTIEREVFLVKIENQNRMLGDKDRAFRRDKHRDQGGFGSSRGYGSSSIGRYADTSNHDHHGRNRSHRYLDNKNL